MEQEILQKNVAIAEMLGAKAEQWYPPNEHLKFSGVHMCYRDKDKFFPNGAKFHAADMLKYHNDFNWQLEALAFIESNGYITNILGKDIGCTCVIRSKDGDELPIAVVSNSSKKEAIFEAIYQFSQYIKNK